MFSTPAHKTRFFCVLLIACAVMAAGIDAADDGVVTSEITSNTILSLAGSNDTIWMATASGLNYTIVPATVVADSFVWWGLKRSAPVGVMAYQGGQLLAGLPDESATYNYNRLFHFDHRTGQVSVIEPGWNLSSIDTSIQVTTFLEINAVTSIDTTFFLAARHGGLVSWNPVVGRRKIFYPGRDSFDCAINAFPSPVVSPFPDSALAVLSVATEYRPGDSSRICTMLPRKLWFFSRRDTHWDSSTIALADPAAQVTACLRLFAVRDSLSTLYATIASSHPNNTEPDTALYRYNRPTNTWTLFLAHKFVHSLGGVNKRLYLIANNEILCAVDSGGGLASLIIPSSQFRQRIQAAGDIPDNCQFTDILLMPHAANSEVSLCIASSFGLFFTRSEFADEVARTPFVHLFRSRTIKNSLKETYAVPGIVNSFNGPTTYFAYNLKKDGAVTIRIFDWNMNPVKIIVKNAPRLAGSNRAEGRSTNMNEDIWDCTDRSNRHVPVGVYYYEIVSNQGERAFGKIIVAQK